MERTSLCQSGQSLSSRSSVLSGSYLNRASAYRYNPDAGPYGFGTWVGELARNAYNTSEVEPYTGRLEGRDYLRDEQLAQMKILAKQYETEIMVRYFQIIFSCSLDHDLNLVISGVILVSDHARVLMSRLIGFVVP